MSKSIINTGTIANDGSGDPLRLAATKINQNFDELYTKLGGEGSTVMPQVAFDSDGILFSSLTHVHTTKIKGASAQAADIVLSLPSTGGEIVLSDATQTLTAKTLTAPAIGGGFTVLDTSLNHSYVFAASELSANRNVTIPLLLTDDVLVFNNHTQTLTNKTLTAPIVSSPRINDGILDNAGSTLLDFSPASSAINYLSVTNAASGNAPVLSVDGAEADIDINIRAKGNGAVMITNRVAYSTQTMTSGTVVDLQDPITIFNTTSAVLASMANGTEIGEEKKLMNINSGEVQVTPTSLKAYSTITLSNDDAVTIVWTGSQWMVTNNEGAVLA
mgnify:CR=1 FL=1